jgi:hypothetical protein
VICSRFLGFTGVMLGIHYKVSVCPEVFERDVQIASDLPSRNFVESLTFKMRRERRTPMAAISDVIGCRFHSL